LKQHSVIGLVFEHRLAVLTTPPDILNGPQETAPCFYSQLIVIANSCYWPATGDFTLGVASELLLFQTVGAAVEPLMLFGTPEFADAAALPLSELVAPGVPYPPVALTGDTTLGVASVLLLCA
jgi:hypothetical protein